jgi:hypothetical protein
MYPGEENTKGHALSQADWAVVVWGSVFQLQLYHPINDFNSFMGERLSYPFRDEEIEVFSYFTFIDYCSL